MDTTKVSREGQLWVQSWSIAKVNCGYNQGQQPGRTTSILWKRDCVPHKYTDCNNMSHCLTAEEIIRLQPLKQNLKMLKNHKFDYDSQPEFWAEKGLITLVLSRKNSLLGVVIWEIMAFGYMYLESLNIF